MNTMMLRIALIAVTSCFCVTSVHADDVPTAGMIYAAQDTLRPGDEPSADARACLDGLAWEPTEFSVECKSSRDRCGDLMIQFPSPIPSGDAANDAVTMEWYVARNEAKMPITAPAVVVVHESGSDMAVGRMFARGLRLIGLHTFMIQLPYYGERRAGGGKATGENLVQVVRQVIGDVRRARDAVAALLLVKTDSISLQGTSLGGFVSATSASLDDGFDRVFILLAGGGLYDVIQNGKKDAAGFRREMEAAGLTGDKLKALVNTVEPTRIAHRLNPKTTWLYTGRFDTVVPPANSRLLARAAKLDSSHHIEMLANHYSGIVFVPYLLAHIQQQIQPGHVVASPANDGQ